jgi:hypothetical protein
MKSVLSLAAVLALAVGVSFTFTDTADAWVSRRARLRPCRSRSDTTTDPA